MWLLHSSRDTHPWLRRQESHDAGEFESVGTVFGEEMLEAGDELGDGDGCRRRGWLIGAGCMG